MYAAGRISQNEGASHAYDISLQKKYVELVSGKPLAGEVDVSVYNHPPFMVPLLHLISIDSYVGAFILWNLMMLVFFTLGTFLMMRLIQHNEIPRQERSILFVGILLYLPFFHSIMVGQDSALLYFGICAWIFGITTGKDWVSGLGLSMTALRPHIAILLVIPFFFNKKKRNIWWWFIVGTALLGIISVAWVGVDGIKGFAHIILISAGGRGYHQNEENMINLLALMLRFFPFIPDDIIRAITWGVYGATLIGLSIMWSRAVQIQEKLVGITIMLSIFTAPHVHYHELSLTTIPLLILILALIRGKYWTPQDAVMLPLIISSTLLLSSIIGAFYLLVFRIAAFILEFFVFLGLLFPEYILFRKSHPINNDPATG